MKKPKPILFLLCAFTLLTGCPKDDEMIIEPSTQELLIATWKPVRDVEVCSGGGQEVYNYNSCEQNGRLMFNTGGTLNVSIYFEQQNGDCLEEDVLSGTCNFNYNTLTLTSTAGTDTFNFVEVNNTVLKIGNNVNGPNEPCSNGVGITRYFTEYSKVN